MLEGFGGAFQAVKSAGPRIFTAVAIAAGALIFLPSSMLNAMGLTSFVETYRGYIGLAFLISIVLLATDAVIWIWKQIKSHRNKRKTEENRVRLIQSLTAEERQYLAPYILEGQNTCYYAMDDGVAGGLNSKGILFISSNIGSLVSGIAFNLQPWARELLSVRSDVFNGITHRPPTAEDRFWSKW